MMKTIATLGAMCLLILAAACSRSSGKTGSSKEELIENVRHFEDSLKTLPAENASTDVSKLYADKCLAVYRAYPESEEAPVYLDKAHVILSGAGFHRVAVQYADTLIQRYPNYKNRPMVLESLASAYDIFIVPRRKDLVEKYYRMLLKENPDMPQEERETIQRRLDNIDLTFDELISLPAGKKEERL